MDHASLSALCSMTVTPVLKRTLHWMGNGLAIIGIFFVILRLYRDWHVRDLSYISLNIWLAVTCLAIFYCFDSFLLAFAWRRILKSLGVDVSRAWSIKIYGISQLAKYVPGNVFHIAGRQALGMSAGISGGILAKSTGWEIGLISVSGAVFSWLVLPLLIPFVTLPTSIALILLTIVGLGYILYRFFSFHLFLAFIYQISFLLISGGIFVILLGALVQNEGGEHLQAWIFICSAYVVAWLVGLVTPGAPAGVGVRELILLFLLKGLVNDEDLLMAVVLGRILTFAGDLLFFSLSSFFLMIKKEIKNE
ncbi:hypothetical protein [Serratia symbiotica]|uniref:Uncharacterized protein n=1 Tax=Serratia symbiotica TaxID=138074 RepID=A0A7D5TA52_9GAMM|nr:hypothetical protein [Serratia symbiotica]QLH64097.1 hypothetical protein SYMBAF_15755 [Serratia symbiotica]QTP14532.1 hypothetical protein GPZ83_0014760 [Serratia symbiotica]